MAEDMSAPVAQFLKDVLETRQASIEKFKENLPNLNFEGVNANVWQFMVLKSFEPEYAHWRPLSHYLLDNNYCLIEGPMVKYAALNGYRLEVGLAAMQKPLDEVNKITQDFGFSEKIVVVNEPAQEIIALTQKIVSKSNDKDYLEVKEILEKAGANIQESSLMKRQLGAPKLKF